MDIREYLQQIAAGYAMDSLHSEGHRLLRLAEGVFKPLLPGGLKVEGSGGKGTATFTPWIGIMDPDEAPDPGNGIYLFYMFQQNLTEVVLTLNQGITKLSKSIGYKDARPVLRESAERIRAALTSDLTGLDTEVDFGTERRQAGYTAGNIAATTYSLADLPPEEQLIEDLRRMVGLYQKSIVAKRALLVTEPGAVRTGSPVGRLEPGESAYGFKPKDRQDYLVQLEGGTHRRRADRHERLLADYAEVAKSLGHQPRNERVHPRDLTLEANGGHWLVEAKVIYNGNAAQAVRAAIGQLMEYAYVLYEQENKPHLMALFTEPIGELYVKLLEGLDIASVWKGENGWQASESALKFGLI
ncbi:DUF3578 domain-containing protein [Arthrobacter sp. zg-Y40]|uniref:MrcB family domain-containing protein n=1 Tax=Arthrobacter sp. zg-Y40 TaxID=2886939 RepID=UPI001D13BB78|nr:DUF3578 domain-containing protein [Arthrobacter sp. zg-Y40]MCC3279915.1 DUF3578 domain-containing protein [Arthrobacter sp. zg-Y40]